MTLAGNRKVLPTPGYGRIWSNEQLAGLEMTDGALLPVSAAAEVRLAYNAAIAQLQASLSGGAYSPLTTDAELSVFRPETYGAVGDGVTDDGPAIQLALLAAAAAGGGIVLFSRKTYGVRQNMGLTGATGVTVRGVGMGATIIQDLRADDPVGAWTGTYQALFHFISCDSCVVEMLSLYGTLYGHAIGLGNTVDNGRCGVLHSDSPRGLVVRVEARGFHDEAICANGDCDDWRALFCSVIATNSNSYNISSGGAQSLGFLILGCSSIDSTGTAFLVAGEAGTIMGCYARHGAMAFDADIVGLDSRGTIIFVGNFIVDTIFTTGTKALAIWGGASPTAATIVSGNTFDGIAGDFAPGGGMIAVSGVGGDDPSGSVVFTDNVFRNCEGINDVANELICFNTCAASFRAYVDGNIAIGDDASYMRTFVRTLNSAAGARVRIGDNELVGWVTEYIDDDNSMVFSGSAYTSDRHLTHVGTPHASLPSDAQVGIDTTTAVATYTLPPVASSKGRNIFVYDEGQNASVNAITVAAQGGETINGVASIDITTDGAGAWCKCDGAVWKTVSVA